MDEHHLSALGPDGLEPGGDYVGAVLGRGSHLAGIVWDPHSLSGNVFEPSPLLDVAQVLGLEVRDIEDKGPPRRH